MSLEVESTETPGKVGSPEPTFCMSDLGAEWELIIRDKLFCHWGDYQSVITGWLASTGDSLQWNSWEQERHLSGSSCAVTGWILVSNSGVLEPWAHSG